MAKKVTGVSSKFFFHFIIIIVMFIIIYWMRERGREREIKRAHEKKVLYMTAAKARDVIVIRSTLSPGGSSAWLLGTVSNCCRSSELNPLRRKPLLLSCNPATPITYWMKTSAANFVFSCYLTVYKLLLSLHAILILWRRKQLGKSLETPALYKHVYRLTPPAVDWRHTKGALMLS